MFKHYESPVRTNGPRQNLNVVIVGGSKGFGSALVHGFHKRGNKVLFTSRKPHLQDTVTNKRLIGVTNNISTHKGIRELEHSVQLYMPDGVDVWINNAAVSDNFIAFDDHNLDRVEEILSTNLTGCIMATHLALRLHKNTSKASSSSSKPCHIFNVIGAGSDGLPTPQFSVYGATKAGIQQFTRSLRAECKNKKAKPSIGVHLLSPGMMPTELLSTNATQMQLQLFNILCEDPEIVAEFMIDKISKEIIPSQKLDADLHYMTLRRVMGNVLTFHQRKNRFFDC